MGTRSVRLDEETEKALARLTRATGMSISEILKRGVSSLEATVSEQGFRKPWDIYRALELGSGGAAKAPARDAKAAVRERIRKKHGR
jgi:Ribbon-helix-helix protein, copG family